MHRAFPLALCLLAAAASGAPELSVDLDPGTPGVQTDATIAVGEMRNIAILVSGVEAGLPLNAYELDLDFHPAVVSATAAADAGFLTGTVQTLESDTADPDVNVAAFTEGPGGASGDGVLATATFTGDADGISVLTLGDVILAAPFGVEIPGVTLNGATLRVPEPTVGSLLAALLLGLAGLARLRRRGRA